MVSPWIAVEFHGVPSRYQPRDHRDVLIKEEIHISDIDKDLWQARKIGSTLALKSMFKNAEVFGIDISEKALDVARQNAPRSMMR